MAKPGFIYEFDNLGPDCFAELCGALLTSRCDGFLLGGVGPDGGIDGEIDNNLGMWRPKAESPLLNEVIHPERLVVFQFKHVVAARVGQTKARDKLLGYYKCKPQKKCELHSDLIRRRRPNVYVLVTNAEVNSRFRTKFKEQCARENSDIEHYQIIGLDELVAWITIEPELRHLYFPAVFGEPRFNLRVKISSAITALSLYGHPPDVSTLREVLEISVLNVGAATSYVGSVNFVILVNGELQYLNIFNISDPIMVFNPQPGTPIEPGNMLGYRFPLDELRRHLAKVGTEVLPVEVLVSDQIGNKYRAAIPEGFRSTLLSSTPKRG